MWEQKFKEYLEQHPLDDGSHDLAHMQRVFNTAKQLQLVEGGNLEVLVAACYFHDIVNIPKNHPDRSKASYLAAEKAIKILKQHFPQYPKDLYSAVFHGIHAHSYSARILCKTIEAKIVQDADRMEALGAIGLARVFYVSGRLNSTLFDSHDPFAQQRQLDEKRYALDHFQTKLLHLPKTMQTATGKQLAQKRADYLIDFMAQLSSELKGEFTGPNESIRQHFHQGLENAEH